MHLSCLCALPAFLLIFLGRYALYSLILPLDVPILLQVVVNQLLAVLIHRKMTISIISRLTAPGDLPTADPFDSAFPLERVPIGGLFAVGVAGFAGGLAVHAEMPTAFVGWFCTGNAY